MREQERPWHQLVMVCPACGTSFRPEVVGLHVRLCPQCEKKKSSCDRNVSGRLDAFVPGREKLSLAR
jgi:hypothetical protein